MMYKLLETFRSFVKLIALLILTILLYLNITNITYIFAGIFPLITNQSITLAFVSMILVTAFFFITNKLNFTNKAIIISIIVMNLIAFLLRIILVLSFDVQPAGDMYAVVASGVEYFYFGDLKPFWPGGYVSNYVHQLGLLQLLSFMFKSFRFNYLPYYILNGMLIQLSILMLSSSVYRKYNPTSGLITTFLLNLFIPAYFMTFYIYGDVLALFALSSIVFMSTLEKSYWVKISLLFLLMTIAYISRSTSIVWMIAFSMITLISKSKVKNKLFIVLALVLAVVLPQKLLITYYNQKEQLNLGENSLPMSAWIAIGTDYSSIDNESPGFYNAKYLDYLIESKFDQSKSNEFNVLKIKNNLSDLIRDNKIFDFFNKKVKLTWTDPDFESMNSILPINYDVKPEDFNSNQAIRLGSGGPDTRYKNLIGEIIWDKMFLIRNLEKVYIISILLMSVYTLIRNRKSNSLSLFFFELLIVGFFIIMLILETKPRYTFVFMMFLITYSGISSFKSKQ